MKLNISASVCTLMIDMWPPECSKVRFFKWAKLPRPVKLPHVTVTDIIQLQLIIVENKGFNPFWPSKGHFGGPRDSWDDHKIR